MSATQPPPTTAATNAAISAARDAPALVNALQSVNPALAALITGSAATYGKSALAPAIGAGVGWFVAHEGLACTAAVATACWSPEFQQTVTVLLCAGCSAAAGAIMHWISKSPARKLLG